MTSVQTQLYAIPLPQFLINFKDTCMRYTLALLDSSISYIENADSAFLMVLLFVLLLQIYRNILIRHPKAVQQEQGNAENRQIGKEIKDLKKELKSIQNMLIQLKSSNFQQAKPQSSIIAPAKAQTSKLIQYCKQSWQKREQLATYIMDWQLKIIKQVIKLKNKNRSSRSPSKNQISSTKQFSAQSKKSIKSTIHHIEVHQENKALFKSDIKINEEQFESEKQEQLQQHKHQQTLISVKIENQPTIETHSQIINIELHQRTKKIEKPEAFHEQITITPSFEQTNEIQTAQQPVNEQKRQILLPPIKANIPFRPPPTSAKKQGKRMVGPPPFLKK